MPTTPRESFQCVYDTWMANPDRWVFVIDETRQHLERPDRQLIVFTCVCIRAAQACQALQNGVKNRTALPEVSKDQTFKGRDLYPLRANPEFSALVRDVAGQVAQCERLFIMGTTQDNLETNGAVGGIRMDTPAGQRVAGPELVPLLTFIKDVANRLGIASGDVDVIIDRSEQLGTASGQLGIGESDSAGFRGQLNTRPDGGPTSMQSPASFMLVFAPEEGPVRDLLVLPDLAGYMAITKNRIDVDAIRQMVRYGELFYVWAVESPRALVEELLMDSSAANPA